MTTPLRTLARHFMHFLGGSAMSLLLSFVTFPILTRLLSREDYGILGLTMTTASFAVAIAKGGLSDGIVRFFREYANSAERTEIFAATLMVRGAAFALVVCIAYMAMVPFILRGLHVDARYALCFYVVGLYLLVRPMNVIVVNIFRARGLTWRYNATNVLSKVLSILIGFLLLIVVIGQLYGYILGLAIAEVCAFVALYWWYLRSYGFHPARASGALAGNLVRFGLPLLLTEISYLLLTYTDRYLIVAFYGEDMLGLYSVGNNVPSYLNELVMFSLSYAIVPIFTNLYVTEGREKTEAFLSRALHFYLIAIIPFCVGYFAVAHDMIVTLASAKYAEAASFSPFVLVGRVLLGMNTILGAGLYLEKRTMHTLAIMLIVVAVNFAANLLLVPSFQAAGAAYALMGACIVSCVLTAALSSRHMKVRIEVWPLVFYGTVSALMYLVVAAIETGSPFLNLLCKTGIGVLMVAVAVLAKEPAARQLISRVTGRAAD